MQSQSNKNNIKLLQHILDYRKPTFGEIRLLLIHNKTAFVKKKKESILPETVQNYRGKKIPK